MKAFLRHAHEVEQNTSHLKGLEVFFNIRVGQFILASTPWSQNVTKMGGFSLSFKKIANIGTPVEWTT